MRLLPMLAPMAQKIVRVDAHHQDGRRRVRSDQIEVSAAVARGASGTSTLLAETSFGNSTALPPGYDFRLDT